jgi:hypothetical protein
MAKGCCDSCDSIRLVSVEAKCSDCCDVQIGSASNTGYVPNDIGIGGGDYIEMDYCLDCGKIQGDFPFEPSLLECDPENNDEDDEDEDEEDDEEDKEDK